MRGVVLRDCGPRAQLWRARLAGPAARRVWALATLCAGSPLRITHPSLSPFCLATLPRSNYAGLVQEDMEEGGDAWALKNGWVALTPLSLLTHFTSKPVSEGPERRGQLWPVDGLAANQPASSPAPASVAAQPAGGCATACVY